MKSFSIAVGFAQLFLLALWEGVGAIYFGLPPLAIFFGWLLGIVTLNTATVTVMRTFIKLTQVTVSTDEEAAALPDITEEDIGA